MQNCTNSTPQFSIQGPYFGMIKTRSTGSGRMEWFGCTTSAAMLGPMSTIAVLPLELKDDHNGVYRVSNGCLYFVKTANCDSGKVELHAIGSAYNFSNFTLHTATAFPSSPNRTFHVDGGNLWCVNCEGDIEGNVTLEVSLGGGNFQDIRWFNTGYKKWMKDYGQFFVRNGSLYYVRTSLCKNGMVQVSRTFRESYNVATGFKGKSNMFFSHNYSAYNTWEYFVTCEDAKNGYFDMHLDGTVNFIKIRNCQSGNVEVHWGYEREDWQVHYGSATNWALVEATCGTFIAASDIDRNWGNAY